MKPREITIRPVLNGFVVSVGCQIVVFDSLSKMIFAVQEYYTNPKLTEGKFLSAKINNMMDEELPMPLNRATVDYDASAKMPEPMQQEAHPLPVRPR